MMVVMDRCVSGDDFPTEVGLLRSEFGVGIGNKKGSLPAQLTRRGNEKYDGLLLYLAGSC